MNKEAWQATVQGLQRVRHDLATKQPQQLTSLFFLSWIPSVLMKCSKGIYTQAGLDLFISSPPLLKCQ